MRKVFFRKIQDNKISVSVTSILLILAIILETSLTIPVAVLQPDQDTPDDQSDGLEYQTIRSLPGEDKTEVVTLDGLMPVNAEVNVQSSQEYTDDNLFAYDISIMDQNGEEFQPKSDEPIKVEITNSAISSAQQANQKLRLWHIDDNGLREEISDFEIRDDKIIFEAAGFSVYEVDNGTPALRTYKFLMPGNPHDNDNYAAYYYPINSHREDGTYKEICSQTIKNGENLILPQLPADIDSKYTFVGWFIGQNDVPGSQQLDFNHIPAVTRTETVELYAVFESCVYAIFHEQYNGRTQTFPVFATRRGQLVRNDQTSKLEAKFYLDDLKVIYDDEDKQEGTPPTMQFVGWTTQPVTDYTTGVTPQKLSSPYVFSVSEDSEDKSIRLYPIFEPIRWIEFDSNALGATFVPPESFPKDQGVVFDNSVPLRAGYTFEGWYTAKDDGVRVTDAAQNLVTTLNTDQLQVRNGKLFVKEPYIQVKLYAHWTPSNSKYTVIIWKQKESDDKDATTKTYDFAESYTFTENVNTEQVVSVSNTYKSKNYTGFYYARCDDAKSVEGNGSTVLNVYYDRCTVVYSFLNSGNNYASTLYTWTGLYGQKISKYNYSWDSTNYWVYKKSGTGITFLESFNSINSSDSNYNASSHMYTTQIYDGGDNSSYQIIHVLQDLNGNYDLNNTDLVYYTNASGGNVTFNFTNKFEGFTVYGYSVTFTPDPSNNAIDRNEPDESGKAKSVSLNNQNLYVYHKRRSFTLKFVDSVTKEVYDISEVLYQAPIVDYKPLDPTAPPTKGYEFTNWYSNEACSSNAAIDFSNTIMPNANMIIYAGWDTIWFRIEIDPNGGELSSTQSTFFWEPYHGDPIEEYTNVSRNYEADVNGTYYYAKHDRAYHGLGNTWDPEEDSITDRGAYYTTDILQAISATRYRKATGAYRYLGWFEVDPDTGEETPYYFGEPVMHDTYLRLHWKQLGTFYIKYDAGIGSIDTDDQNEKTFEFLDSEDYADHANVVVTRVAKPVDGMNFVGWRIKHDPSETVYYPGQSFLFSSAYAEAISKVNPDTGAVEVKRTIIMEAVYEQIRTAKIIYDANGGIINDPDNAILPANAGGQVIHNAPVPVDDPDYYARLSVKYDVTETQLTVSDLLNNSAVKLSNGTCFYNHGYTFLGWSPKRDGSEVFYDEESITTTNRWVDVSEPTILYAQWEVKVYFDRNDVKAPTNTYYWGNGTGNDWENDNKYILDASKGMYYTMIKLHGKVDKPMYTPTSSDTEEIFSNWSLEKQSAPGVMKPVFDFVTTGVTQDMIDSQHNDGDYLVLHACWKAPIRIPVYYVDTSDEEWVRRDSWRKDGDGANIVLRDDSHVSLAGRTQADSYAKDNMTTGYTYAFAAKEGNANEDYKHITDTVMITEIWYDSDEMCVKVEYSDHTEHEFDAADDAVYLIYHKSSYTVDVNYDLMAVDSNLTSVSSLNASAPQTAGITSDSPYSMQGHIVQPIEWSKWGNGNDQKYKYYSFAIGKPNASSTADLKVITDYKTSDSDRPELLVRINWNGYECSFDGVNWHNCGYDVALYAVYYEQLPNILNLREKTIALQDKMGTEFAYEITITQTESKTVTRTFYIGNTNTIINSGQYLTTSTPYSDTTTITTLTDFRLSNLETDSFVLFYSSPADTATEKQRYLVDGEPQTYGSGWFTYDVYYQDRTTNQKITQSITITQVQNTDFTTSNDAVNGDQVYNSNYTSSANADPVTITYTNRQNLEKAVNVAVSGGDRLTAHNDLRNTNTSIYLHDFTNNADWNLSDTAVVSPSALIGGRSDYIFLGIITGTEQNSTITKKQTNITKLSFGEIHPGVYGYYLNGDTAQLLQNQEIWFIYAKKPTIRYLYEKPDGTFEEITVFTRNNEPFIRAEITQGEIAPVTDDGLLIDQISTPGMPAFLIPGDLDYQDDALRLDLNRLCLGDSSGITESSDSESMQITLTNEKLQYRFHDTDTPRNFADNAVIYAVYKIKGYELTLTKQVLGDAAGNNVFTFEISSDQLTYSSYDTSKGRVTSSGNKITLNLQRGGSVTIYGLLSGEYTVRETTAGNYEMTAKVNDTDVRVTGNRVAASIADNTRIDVLNTYPIPVTLAAKDTVHHVIVVMILMAAVIVFICRRKGEKQNERSSL